jgi:two-component system, cell cycle sensor histidine kinase and response regulator CckA
MNRAHSSSVRRRERKPIAIVADDDSCVRAMLAMSLEETGFSVVQASDGLALAGLADDWQNSTRPFPTLVLSDVNMPYADGITLLPRLKQLLPGTWLIVMSGSVAAGLEGSALRAGADAFICKPFRLEELLALIAALVSNTTPADCVAQGGGNDGRRAPTSEWPPQS